MNEIRPICDSCDSPIHWVDGEQRFYHDDPIDTLICGAVVIVPATAEV